MNQFVSRQCAAVSILVALAGVAPAKAESISNPVAVFNGLDKITARITRFEVPIGRTALFGTLEVTPRVCNTKPPTEPPQTTAFVEVYERRHEAAKKRLFVGWMFADSPGLSGVEHPVYDVWLTGCKTASG